MKAKNIFTPAIILFASAFSLGSCSKSDPEPPQLHYLKFSPQALEYVQVPPGKYRVYRDSATSVLDSVIVTQSRLQTNDIPVSNFLPAYKSQSFDMTYTKMNGTPTTTWLQVEAALLMVHPPYSSETEPLFLWERSGPLYFTIGTIFHAVPGTLTRTVEGVTYNNVLATYSDAGVDINHPAYRKTVYYWVKNIGLIERQTITTGGQVKTYYLLRYN